MLRLPVPSGSRRGWARPERGCELIRDVSWPPTPQARHRTNGRPDAPGQARAPEGRQSDLRREGLGNNRLRYRPTRWDSGNAGCMQQDDTVRTAPQLEATKYDNH